MKKLLLVLLLSMPVFVFAQNKITLNDSTEFLAIIDGLFRETLVFNDDIEALNDDRVDIGRVVSIAGETPKYRQRSILKKNPSVVFIPANYTKQDVERFKSGDITVDSPIAMTNIELTAGDYIYRAGQRYLTGVTFSIAGGAMMAFGASQDEEALYYIGGGAILVGFISSITGHVQLKKAGEKMNSDAITMSAARSGLGVAINF